MKTQVQQTDKRVFTRIPFDANLDVVLENGEQYTSRLLDISLKGALIKTPDQWQAHTDVSCTLNIHLSEDTTVVMECHVTHVEKERTGLICDHIDVASISHLRRIIEQNTADENLLHRELSALVHASKD